MISLCIADVRKLDPGIGNAHFRAAQLRRAEFDLSGRRRFIVRGRWQVAVTSDRFTVRSDHQIDGASLGVAPQQIADRNRDLQRHLAAIFLDVVSQQFDVCCQRAVVGHVCNGLGGQIGDCHAHRPKQQQRRQHPVENFTEERDLLVAAPEWVGEPDRPPLGWLEFRSGRALTGVGRLRLGAGHQVGRRGALVDSARSLLRRSRQ
jgi:hypothetical protein